MNDLNLNIQAGGRFISSEMQELSEQVIFLIPNWKWLALIVGFVALYFIRQFLVILFKKIRKAQAKFLNKTYLDFLFELEVEKALSKC